MASAGSSVIGRPRRLSMERHGPAFSACLHTLFCDEPLYISREADPGTLSSAARESIVFSAQPRPHIVSLDCIRLIHDSASGTSPSIGWTIYTTKGASMQRTNTLGVDVLHWNPKRPYRLRPRRLFAWTRDLSFSPRVHNFGDLIGPLVVAQIASKENLFRPNIRGYAPPQLGTVGSIIHMLSPNTFVWGSGINGKNLADPLPQSLRFAAVRGPLTGRYLEQHGHTDPGVYGDPALLMDYTDWIPKSGAGEGTTISCINNLNDPAPRPTNAVNVITSTDGFGRIIRAISQSYLVVGSSLHAIIVAEALGVPARAASSTVEPRFKYEDYYEGTGRAGVTIAPSIDAAIELGGVSAPPVVGHGLADAFPAHLWRDADEN